ncbi:MAG: TIGR04255 family protein [Nitrospirota bacterium]
MSRKYSNPPIVEALCEFQFIPTQPWDMTIPGLLYEKISGEFPVKQQQMGFGIGFQPKEGGIEQKVEMSQRMQFLRPDKSALVQIGPDLLAVNHLKPYPTWDTFKPMIFKNLEAYQTVAKPKGFKRIGLRYINKFEFDKSPIELTDYFNYYPFIPTNLPQMHETFQVRVEIPYEEGRDCLLLNFASTIPEKPDALSLLLDLDYIMAIPERVPLDQTSDWLEKAHTTIENAFEACITDKCRSHFEEEK